MRKIWWAPIFAIFNELLYAALFIKVPGSRLILVACAIYIVIYAKAIPKWRRERK